ncbi:MAG: fumarylacetoacetase [Bacteroidota bacterium]
MIKANNPQLKSWIEVPKNSDFPIQNIPFGVIKTISGTTIASRIGDTVISISALYKFGYLNDLGLTEQTINSSVLNDFIALGKKVTNAVREKISELFVDTNSTLKNNDAHKAEILFSITEIKNALPVRIENYTDFYSSKEHATNVGTMFRDPKNALLPNWLHIPIGYHGRASSIVISGTSIHRPKGQTKAPDAELPSFGPSKQLDFELELAFVVGKETQLGDSIPIDKAEEFIFGLVLFNDWSARDIQAWEYVPLGPFLAKNFASTISPWIVTLEALEPFRVAGPTQEPKVLPYLDYKGAKNYDINLDVIIKPKGAEETVVSKSNFKYMYWNMAQQLTHHTVNGCNMKVGDMYASGTISGPTEDSYGSMLEITWRGTKPLKMKNGTERKFIDDGDTVIIKGYCEKDGVRIGFGESASEVLPTK